MKARIGVKNENNSYVRLQFLLPTAILHPQELYYIIYNLVHKLTYLSCGTF